MKKVSYFALFTSLLLSSSCAMEKEERVSGTLLLSHRDNNLPNMNEEPYHQDIIKFQSDLEQIQSQHQFQNLEYLSKDKDIVACIGNTGEGKSTLLNLMIGKNLKPSFSGYDVEDAYFKIGHGSKSETLFPKVVEHNNRVFVDLPGLLDSRGDAIAFLNSIYIKTILTQAKSVIFLFVESKGSAEAAKGANFKELLSKTSKLLDNKPDILKNSSTFVFSKSDIEDSETFMEEFLQKKMDPKIIEDLNKITSENNILPFLHSSKFVKKDSKTKEQKIDWVYFNDYISTFRQNVAESISSLQGVKVSSINQEALLNPGTNDLIAKLFQILTLDSIKQSTPNIENLNLVQLTDLRQDLSSIIEEGFLKNVDSQKHLKLIKQFDDNLYSKELKSSLENLRGEIKSLGGTLNYKIIEEEKKDIKKKLNKIQEEKVKADQISKQKLEELAQALEQQKIQEAHYREKMQEEKKRVQEEADRLGKEEIALKEKYQISKDEEKNLLIQAIAVITSTEDHRTLCKNIEDLFEDLSNKKKQIAEHREYMQSRSTAGTIVKGIITLGIHAIDNHKKEERLETECRNIRNELGVKLNQYKTSMLGTPHHRHNEV